MTELAEAVPGAAQPIDPEQLLLKDYEPVSIYRIPETRVGRARYPAIDVHNHPWDLKTPEQVDGWVRSMDEAGVEATIMQSGATGEAFERVAALLNVHQGRFVLWCGLDCRGFMEADFGQKTRDELQRCQEAGARGVGELVDKGRGLCPRLVDAQTPPLHADDPRLDPVWGACTDLGLPINLHVGEDSWMYGPMDATNDGYMNAYKWRIPEDPQVMRHDEVVATLDNVARNHPRMTIVAAHFANCCSDLSMLAGMLDAYPNLYADISARFAETSPIPRYMAKFYERYQDRLMYGTDVWISPEFYRITFRILESEDEHFYATMMFKYHWPLHGFGLSDEVLQKVYVANARRVLGV